MPITFSAGELINIATGIEKRGIAYYEALANSSWHEAARDLFRNLAEMERRHVATFEGMLPDKDKYQPSSDVSEDYDAYLQGLINSAVFTDEIAAGELAEHLDNEIEAIDIAISAEKDSILFYYYMAEILPPAETIVRKILDEERLHLIQLAEIKTKIINMR